VVAVGTHAAAGSGVAAAEWLAATLSSGEFNAGGPGARDSAVVDCLCPSSEHCAMVTLAPVPRVTWSQGKSELSTRCENCKAGRQEGRELERKMRVHIVLGRMPLRILRGTK